MADTFSVGDVIVFKDRAAWTVTGRHGVNLHEVQESEHQYGRVVVKNDGTVIVQWLRAHEVYPDQLVLTGRRMIVREDDILDRVSVVFLYEDDVVETPPGFDDDGLQKKWLVQTQDINGIEAPLQKTTQSAHVKHIVASLASRASTNGKQPYVLPQCSPPRSAQAAAVEGVASRSSDGAAATVAAGSALVADICESAAATGTVASSAAGQRPRRQQNPTARIMESIAQEPPRAGARKSQSVRSPPPPPRSAPADANCARATTRAAPLAEPSRDATSSPPAGKDDNALAVDRATPRPRLPGRDGDIVLKSDPGKGIHMYEYSDSTKARPVILQHGAIDNSAERWHAALRNRFGHTAFREAQLQAIQTLATGRSVVYTAKTSSGKSLVYQLLASELEKTVVVIVPLVAIMLQQLANLRQHAIAAVRLESTTSPAARESVAKGEQRVVFVSPESLHNATTMGCIQQLGRSGRLHAVVIDEVHLMEDWASFRDTQLVPTLVRQLQVPVLAMTATLTPRIAEEVIRKLDIAPVMIQCEVERFDIILGATEFHGNAVDKALELAEAYLAASKPFVIFFHSSCELLDVHSKLDDSAKGQIATFFTSARARGDRPAVNMSDTDKEHVLERFRAGVFKGVLATSAFGLGVDVSVDVVAIMHLPPNMAMLAQMAGRVGRRGQGGRAELFWQRTDLSRPPAGANAAIDSLARHEVQLWATSDRCRQEAMGLAFAPASSSGRHALICGVCDVCRRQTLSRDETELAKLLLSVAKGLEESLGYPLGRKKIVLFARGSSRKTLVEKIVPKLGDRDRGRWPDGYGAAADATEGRLGRIFDHLNNAGMFCVRLIMKQQRPAYVYAISEAGRRAIDEEVRILVYMPRDLLPPETQSGTATSQKSHRATGAKEEHRGRRIQHVKKSSLFNGLSEPKLPVTRVEALPDNPTLQTRYYMSLPIDKSEEERADYARKLWRQHSISLGRPTTERKTIDTKEYTVSQASCQGVYKCSKAGCPTVLPVATRQRKCRQHPQEQLVRSGSACPIKGYLFIGEDHCVAVFAGAGESPTHNHPVAAHARPSAASLAMLEAAAVRLSGLPPRMFVNGQATGGIVPSVIDPAFSTPESVAKAVSRARRDGGLTGTWSDALQFDTNTIPIIKATQLRELPLSDTDGRARVDKLFQKAAPYVRECQFTMDESEPRVVLTMSPWQSALLMNASMLAIDVTYNELKDSSVKTLQVSTYCSEIEQTLVLARARINHENEATLSSAFKKMLAEAVKDTDVPILLALEAITVDFSIAEHNAIKSAFAQYVEDIDSKLTGCIFHLKQAVRKLTAKMDDVRATDFAKAIDVCTHLDNESDFEEVWGTLSATYTEARSWLEWWYRPTIRPLWAKAFKTKSDQAWREQPATNNVAESQNRALKRGVPVRNIMEAVKASFLVDLQVASWLQRATEGQPMTAHRRRAHDLGTQRGLLASPKKRRRQDPSVGGVADSEEAENAANDDVAYVDDSTDSVDDMFESSPSRRRRTNEPRFNSDEQDSDAHEGSSSQRSTYADAMEAIAVMDPTDVL